MLCFAGCLMPTVFQEKVYRLCKKIPRGKVTTYGEIARALGVGGGARAVGQALRRNPYAPQVPCHRVVAHDGRLCGFNGARSGTELERKAALLRREGVRLDGEKVAEFNRVFCRMSAWK